MKCPQCGQSVEPSATFCGNCGMQLQQPAETQPGQQPDSQSVSVAPVEPAAQMSSVAPNPPIDPQMPPQPMASSQQMGAPVAPAQMPMTSPSTHGQHVPAYAMGQNHAAEGDGLLTWAVVLASLSIPGAILPIVGLAFGITAIVLAAKHHHAGTGRMVAAIVVGSIGVVLSLAAWAYNVQHIKHTAFLQPTTVTTSTSMVQASPAIYRTLFMTNH